MQLYALCSMYIMCFDKLNAEYEVTFYVTSFCINEFCLYFITVLCFNCMGELW